MYYNNFLFFHLQITVKNHTMVCKACNSHVHNTNDMTLLHLNECFCKVQPHRALLSYPFCNTAAHTEATPTREGI